MRQRHADCLKALQDQVQVSQEEALEERRKLHENIEDLSEKVHSHRTAEQIIHDLHAEHAQKLDSMHAELATSLTRELERLGVSARGQPRDGQDVVICELQTELDEARLRLTESESESVVLGVKYSAMEERARMLEKRQAELQKARLAQEEEQQVLKDAQHEQMQRLSACEVELEARRGELTRCERSSEELARQHAAGRQRETELRCEISELERRGEDHVQLTQREARSQSERDGAELRAQLQQLRTEVQARDERISDMEDMEMRAEETQRLMHSELLDASHRERELMAMLHEVQEGIIVAAGAGPEEEEESE